MQSRSYGSEQQVGKAYRHTKMRFGLRILVLNLESKDLYAGVPYDEVEGTLMVRTHTFVVENSDDSNTTVDTTGAHPVVTVATDTDTE